MLIPSTPVALIVVTVLAILLTLDWFVGAMAYNQSGSRVEDRPKVREAASLKQAAWPNRSVPDSQQVAYSAALRIFDGLAAADRASAVKDCSRPDY
jgi:hypothetical protein